MDDAYGKTYNLTNSCWEFNVIDDLGESTAYCMRPGEARVVETAHGSKLYFSSFNATDIRDDARFIYSHVQPGLMGAFKINLEGERGWSYDASDKAMEYGLGGECGCAHALFAKVDNAGGYAWMFVSGGSWQGYTVANHSVVTAVDHGIEDISRIPQIREGAPNVRYEIAVRANSSTQGKFPLRVTKLDAGTKLEEFEVAFDPTTLQYALPEGR